MDVLAPDILLVANGAAFAILAQGQCHAASVILKSEMERGTEFVEVQFGGKYGKKRLSMDFAKLEKL